MAGKQLAPSLFVQSVASTRHALSCDAVGAITITANWTAVEPTSSRQSASRASAKEDALPAAISRTRGYDFTYAIIGTIPRKPG